MMFFFFFYIHKFRKKQPRAVDLSEVIDFKSVLEFINRGGNLPPDISVLGREFDHTVFCLEKRPGMQFLFP